jgi:hypothetical protein
VETKSIASPKRAPRKFSVSYQFWFVMSAFLMLFIGMLLLPSSIVNV